MALYSRFFSINYFIFFIFSFILLFYSSSLYFFYFFCLFLYYVFFFFHFLFFFFVSFWIIIFIDFFLIALFFSYFSLFSRLQIFVSNTKTFLIVRLCLNFSFLLLKNIVFLLASAEWSILIFIFRSLMILSYCSSGISFECSRVLERFWNSKILVLDELLLIGE